MTFKPDDDFIEKFYDIFEHIEEKLGIGLNSSVHESRGEEYLKTTVSDKILFEKDNETNIIPNERVKYKCNVTLQIQSVLYNMEDKDIKYYPQVLLEDCCYEAFSNNRMTNLHLKHTDKPESESESESEEEINDDTV